MTVTFNVRLGDRYAGLARGIGRWYSAIDYDGTHFGYVWTDDRERLGLIDTRKGPRTEEAVAIFEENKNQWASNNLSASEAFSESLAIQNNAYGVTTTVEEGDLFSDLILNTTEKELKTMARRKSYSVTIGTNNNILELIRSDTYGMYYRDNFRWIKIPSEARAEEFPTVYSQEWVDVSENIVAFYDKNSDKDLVRNDIKDYLVIY